MELNFLSKVILPISLFIIMWGMGLSLKIADFKRVVTQPKAATIGILCQMVMLPAVGLIIALAFGLSPELAVGLMILSFCPGGVTSNMYTYLSNGDTALSISLTAIVSVLTPFTIPIFTLWMMDYFQAESQQFSLPVLKTMLQLVVITIVPVSIGMLMHRKLPNFSAAAEKPVKVFSIVLLFIIIAGIVANEWENMTGYFVQTGLATFVLNIATLLLGFGIALGLRLKKAEAISIGFEVGIQNGTLALLVTGSLLQNTLMTIPAVTYSLIMFATGALFSVLVRK